MNFLPVFRSNQLRFSLYKLPASENNLSEYTKDDGAVKYFLVKLARCAYFVLFKFHKFKTLSSSVSAFKLSVAKQSFISA